MNICRLCLYYPSEQEKLGGFYQGLYNMTQAQVDLKNKVSVITSRSVSKKQKKFETQRKLKIHRVFSSLKGPLMLNYWAFGLNATAKFSDINRKENFDLIHAHDRDTFLFGIIHKALGKKPLFMHSHGLIRGWEKAGVLEAGPYKNLSFIESLTLKSRMVYEGIAARDADFVFVYSEFAKKEMNEIYDIDPEKIHVIMNGCDTEFFKPGESDLRAKLGIGEDAFVIFLAGIDIRKGFDYFVKAMEKIVEKHPKVRVIAVGGGVEIAREKLSQKIREKFIFQGPVSFDQMPKYYNACDLFVLPTIYEGLPKSIMEAMACEKPVLSTDICGIPELVRDGENGFLAEARDAKTLEEKINYVIENYQDAKKTAKRGRELILREYTWKRFAERINEGYKLYFEKFH